MLKIISLIGPSGCGKGTQAEKLANEFNYKIIGGSTILRLEINTGSLVGKKIQQAMDEGQFVNDFNIAVALNNHGTAILETVLQDSKINGLIFDGLPRTGEQYNMVNNWLNNFSLKINYLIEFDLSDEESINRIKYREKTSDKPRNDDKDIEVIKERLKNYRETILPIREISQKDNSWYKVDANNSIESIYSDIVTILK